MITSLSPDSIRSTKKAINESNHNGSVYDAWKNHTESWESDITYEGENILVRGSVAIDGNEIRIDSHTLPYIGRPEGVLGSTLFIVKPSQDYNHRVTCSLLFPSDENRSGRIQVRNSDPQILYVTLISDCFTNQ